VDSEFALHENEFLEGLVEPSSFINIVRTLVINGIPAAAPSKQFGIDHERVVRLSSSGYRPQALNDEESEERLGSFRNKDVQLKPH
jgi:hypothetical protein